VEEVDNMSKTLKSALAVLNLAIDIGHNVPFDGGAVGIRSENELNFEVGSRLIKKCEAAGIKVIDCTPKNVKSHFDSLNKRVVAANKGGADFFISIHHNACLGGYGTEILCYPESRAEGVAKIILPEIVSLGFRNRGVKPRKGLFVLSETKMPAVLLELGFIDNEKDLALITNPEFQQELAKVIGKALAEISGTQTVDYKALYEEQVKKADKYEMENREMRQVLRNAASMFAKYMIK